MEGLDLQHVPAVFTHDNAQLRGGREDVVTTDNSITVIVGQFTTFLTAGIGDRFDLSVAAPVITNDLTVVSNATIHRLGTTNPLTHFFRQANGDVGEVRTFWAGRRVSGLGDVTLRMKGEQAPGVWGGAWGRHQAADRQRNGAAWQRHDGGPSPCDRPRSVAFHRI